MTIMCHAVVVLHENTKPQFVSLNVIKPQLKGFHIDNDEDKQKTTNKSIYILFNNIHIAAK